MSAVEIAVPEHKLAARLVAIETWLYKKKCKPVRFETTPEQSGIVLIRVEFDADSLVEAFRRAFGLASRVLSLGSQENKHASLKSLSATNWLHPWNVGVQFLFL